MSINSGAVLQFSLLAHTVPVSVELDRDEVEMKVNKGTRTIGRSRYLFAAIAVSTAKRFL